MEQLINKFINEEIAKMTLKEKMTSHLVKKKRRGTLQALEESTVFEKEITDKVLEYMRGWLLNEFIDGPLKQKIEKEISEAVYLEVVRIGFQDIYKKNKL